MIESIEVYAVSALNRANLVKIHMLLAAFMFPVACMFLITGGFYIEAALVMTRPARMRP